MHDLELTLFYGVKHHLKTMYIQKRSPHKVLVVMDLEEKFSDKKPRVGHMRMFGSPIYIHVPKYKRNNLDPLGKKSYFFVITNHQRPTKYTFYRIDGCWVKYWGLVNQYFKTHIKLSISYSNFCMLLSLSAVMYAHNYNEEKNHTPI